jgi:thiamine-phosphate pyrophosphorylase
VGTAHPADAAAILRTLDAAANRGREGLRVLEDFARFGLNDAHLTARLKDARHRLSRLLDSLAGDAPLRLRDTPGDVGTSIHNTSEATRESDRDLVVANCKRVQSYTLEQALLTTRQANARLAGVRLCLLATTALCRGGIERVVRGALDGGCGMIQLREKSIPDRELLALARQVRDWTRAAGALLIVNDRADISVLADADGVHVGEDDLSVAEARRIVGPDRLVGVSTHSLDQARAGVLAGADYLGVGPVFPSQTKEFETLAGLDYVRQVAAEIALPWFAIGGIDVGNIGEVAAAGGRRMAVSRVVGQAADPAAAARELNQRLQDIS